MPLNNNIIDISKITKIDQELIARNILPMVEDYFKDPKVQRNYKIWLKNRNENKLLG